MLFIFISELSLHNLELGFCGRSALSSEKDENDKKEKIEKEDITADKKLALERFAKTAA